MELRIAFVGVIATGVVGLAGIITTFFAPDWAQKRIEQRRLAGDFRTARRLVTEELLLAEIHAKAIAEHKHAFPPDWTYFLITREWEAHKTTLARALRNDVWVAVSGAYTAIEQVRNALGIAPAAPLENRQQELVESVHRLAHGASDKLAAAKPVIE